MSQDEQVKRILAEELLSLAEAGRRFPTGRGSGQTTNKATVNKTTIWRWCCRGVRLADGSRLKLEFVRVGGRHLTSAEALTRFIQLQTADRAREVATNG